MALTLREIAGANFRTSEESDTVNTDFMEHLGSRTRYLPARLAIGRSLRVAASPPAVEQSGKTIKGETLFGDELGPWLAMLTEHDGREDIALRGLQAIVAAHWARGIGMLQRDWAAAGQDRDRLLRKLAEDAGLSPTLAAVSGDELMPSFGSGAIQVPIGEIGKDEQGQIVTWRPNAPAGSPHLAVMGGTSRIPSFHLKRYRPDSAPFRRAFPAMRNGFGGWSKRSVWAGVWRTFAGSLAVFMGLTFTPSGSMRWPVRRSG